MRKRVVRLSFVLVAAVLSTAAFRGERQGVGRTRERFRWVERAAHRETPLSFRGVVGTISTVACDGGWFLDQGAARLVFNTASQANGARLKAGTYYVYRT